MKRLCRNPRFLLLILLGGMGLWCGGCGSTESENMSVRPWDSPMGWENGVPASMTEGH